METIKMYCLIHELKGIIESMQEFANYDEEFHTPLNNKLQEKMNELLKVLANEDEDVKTLVSVGS